MPQILLTFHHYHALLRFSSTVFNNTLDARLVLCQVSNVVSDLNNRLFRFRFGHYGRQAQAVFVGSLIIILFILISVNDIGEV